MLVMYKVKCWVMWVLLVLKNTINLVEHLVGVVVNYCIDNSVIIQLTFKINITFFFVKSKISCICTLFVKLTDFMIGCSKLKFLNGLDFRIVLYKINMFSRHIIKLYLNIKKKKKN